MCLRICTPEQPLSYFLDSFGNGILRTSLLRSSKEFGAQASPYSLETLIPLKYASNARGLERITKAPELQRLREGKEA
jgi:hypothetical protein